MAKQTVYPSYNRVGNVQSVKQGAACPTSSTVVWNWPLKEVVCVLQLASELKFFRRFLKKPHAMFPIVWQEVDLRTIRPSPRGILRHFGTTRLLWSSWPYFVDLKYLNHRRTVSRIMPCGSSSAFDISNPLNSTIRSGHSICNQLRPFSLLSFWS